MSKVALKPLTAVKKPIPVQVIRYDGSLEACHLIEEWAKLTDRSVYKMGGVLYIGTMEGRMETKVGSYVIKGVEDEIYPCDAAVFEKSYEIIPDTDD